MNIRRAKEKDIERLMELLGYFYSGDNKIYKR